MTPEAITAAIAAERRRQLQKWTDPHEWGAGDCSSNLVATNASAGDTADLLRLTVLTEEVGEVGRAILDRDHPNLRAELIQVAAVAVAWLEGM